MAGYTMNAAIKLALMLALSWCLAAQAGVTPLDGIEQLSSIGDFLR
jgi:hypothetical protein